MTKKNWLLIGILVLLTTVYAFCFTDWFKPKVIEIFHTCRTNRLLINQRRPGAPKPTTIPVLFGLEYRYQLTELKVYRLSEWQTNHEVLPMWHLVSSSNSVPLKQFYYGTPIRGMKAAVQGSRPAPLEPNVTYHLILTAGKAKGEHDFETKPAN